MSLLSDGAFPMGILFLGAMVVGALRRKTGVVLARAQYPKLAQKWGLSFKPSPYKNGVGKLEGLVEGYSVTVDPDEQKRIYVRFVSEPQVELHSYVHNKRPVADMLSFRPSSPTLAAQFKTAHASTAIMDRLNTSKALDDSLQPLKFLRPLKTLSATSTGVTAVFDFGNPPYIPAEVVDDLLPRLVLLAQVIEGKAQL